MRDLHFLEEAEQEYTASLEWYAQRSLLAAHGFETEIEIALENIKNDPEFYPLCDNRHRYCLLKKYPFKIIFRTTSAQIILVVAVAHASRKPGFWKNR